MAVRGTERPGRGPPVWLGQPRQPASGWVGIVPRTIGPEGESCSARLSDSTTCRAIEPCDYSQTSWRARASAWSDSTTTARATRLVAVQRPGWRHGRPRHARPSHCCAVHGPADVSLVGMRFGALLATAVADQDRGMDQLVLWDPCTTGRSFLAEERAIARLSGHRPAVTVDDGSLEAPCIVYDAATVADIKGMRIDDCTLPLCRRVLVLARADRPRAEVLNDRDLARETLAQAEALGQHELMDLPEQELPLASVQHIVGWLREGAGPSLRTISVPEAGGQAVVDTDTLGRRVIETPVTVPPAGLSGVLTEPGDGRTPPGAPVALMFNAGMHHHVGPARSWVDLSRQVGRRRRAIVANRPERAGRQSVPAPR